MMKVNNDVNDGQISSFNPCKVAKRDMEIYSFSPICRKNGSLCDFQALEQSTNKKSKLQDLSNYNTILQKVQKY